MSRTCPKLDTLRAFNEGLIKEVDEIDRISAHLATCSNCIDELERMEPSPLAKGLSESLILINEEDSTELVGTGFHSDKLMTSRDPFAIGDRNVQKHAEQRYQVLSLLGEGNFGSTFLARTESNDLFALKIPHHGKLTTAIHYRQFMDDCNNAISLKHPNIEAIQDHGNWDLQRLFYSTKYSETRLSLTTLGKRALANESARLKPAQAISFFEPIIEAIQFAHKKEVIHRHLSPDNIWIGDDHQIQVSDFGFVMDSRYHFELVEPIKKTNPFLSPESINNNASFVDHRSDIFSMGRILKMLLTISEKFEPETENQVKQVITVASNHRRRERYQTLDEFCDAWQNATKAYAERPQ